MKVHKVYYNGNEFTYDKEMVDMPSKTPKERTTHFVMNESDAKGLIETLNNDLKKSVEEMTKYRHFIIRKCKDCGDYFAITKNEVAWYKNKGFSLPVRCLECRRERKYKK